MRTVTLKMGHVSIERKAHNDLNLQRLKLTTTEFLRFLPFAMTFLHSKPNLPDIIGLIRSSRAALWAKDLRMRRGKLHKSMKNKNLFLTRVKTRL